METFNRFCLRNMQHKCQDFMILLGRRYHVKISRNKKSAAKNRLSRVQDMESCEDDLAFFPNKSKQPKPSEASLIELLQPFKKFILGKRTQAFQSLIDQYSEIISSAQFFDIVKKTQDIKDIAEQVLRHSTMRRVTRKDAEAGAQRISDKYKGKQPGNIWDIYSKSLKILFRHEEEWANYYKIDRQEWIGHAEWIAYGMHLGHDIATIQKIQGCDMRVVKKIWDELQILRALFDSFKQRVEKITAKQKKTENDKTFLNSIKTSWGNDAKYILGDLPIEKRGQKISRDSLLNKWEKVADVIAKAGHKKGNTDSSKYYNREVPAFLTIMAHIAYLILYSIPKYKSERTLKIQKYEEARKKRALGIIEAQRIIDKYDIRSYDLKFGTNLETYGASIFKGT